MITFAGSAPGLIAGMVQINVQVPSNLPTGINLNAVTLSLLENTYDFGIQSGVTIALR